MMGKRIKMLTPVQELILECFVIRPENPKAFARYKNRECWGRNREGILAHKKEFRETNRDRLCGVRKKERDCESFREKARMYAKRHRSNPDVRVGHNLRVRVYEAMKDGTKSARTCELLGCTILELRAHLEKQFRPGMTWENYGPVWHIDHRRPCASFDLLDPAQQRVCFHYTNLQPLFAEENFKKGAR